MKNCPLCMSDVKPFTTAPAGEMELSVPMNEEWQLDGGCVTGLDKQLELTLRANETSSQLTKI